MSIITKLIVPNNSVYYSESFLLVIEDHLDWLKKANDTKILNISPSEAHAFRWSLSALLFSHNVPVSIHHITARLNNLQSTSDYDGTLFDIYVPSETAINGLASKHRATYTM